MIEKIVKNVNHYCIITQFGVKHDLDNENEKLHQTHNKHSYTAEAGMKFYNPTASLYIPGGKSARDALKRTTHLGICAHQDDLEISAFHGIRQCYRHPDQWFGGIICTNGGGSPRSGKYASVPDEEMSRIRKKEQEKAAELGEYSFVTQLDYPSALVKDPDVLRLKDELSTILSTVKPSVVYTHNPADKHETHIGTVVAVIQAIRKLPLGERPGTVYGCEAWRNLDWMMDDDKIALDVSDTDNLGKKLIAEFDSQITGGKRYDLASPGRWRANATFHQSHETDKAKHLIFAMDLSPLAAADSLDMLDYVMGYVQRFQQDVESKLKRRLNRIKE
jgi:LmbE family N-acetylglucosaminyl deacetylase